MDKQRKRWLGLLDMVIPPNGFNEKAAYTKKEWNGDVKNENSVRSGIEVCLSKA
jgi:hypothetical protein